MLCRSLVDLRVWYSGEIDPSVVQYAEQQFVILADRKTAPAGGQ